MKKILVSLIVTVLLCSSIAIATTSTTKNTDEKTKAVSISKTFEVINEDLETHTETIEKVSYNPLSEIKETEGYKPAEMEEGISPNVIIGEDDRIPSSTFNWPYSAVCYIIANFANGEVRTGSGFLTDDNVAVTCAHMVKGAQSVQVIPGRWGDTYRYGSTWAKNIVTHNYYDVNNYTTEYDWAILKLVDRIGQNTGWFGVERYEDYSVLNGERVMTAGYPNDLGLTIVYRSYGNVSDTTNLTFKHNADIWYGNSGGPMARTSDTQVVGIQSGHDLSENINYATRVDNEFFYLLLGIIQED